MKSLSRVFRQIRSANRKFPVDGELVCSAARVLLNDDNEATLGALNNMQCLTSKADARRMALGLWQTGFPLLPLAASLARYQVCAPPNLSAGTPIASATYNNALAINLNSASPKRTSLTPSNGTLKLSALNLGPNDWLDISTNSIIIPASVASHSRVRELVDSGRIFFSSRQTLAGLDELKGVIVVDANAAGYHGGLPSGSLSLNLWDLFGKGGAAAAGGVTLTAAEDASLVCYTYSTDINLQDSPMDPTQMSLFIEDVASAEPGVWRWAVYGDLFFTGNIGIRQSPLEAAIFDYVFSAHSFATT